MALINRRMGMLTDAEVNEHLRKTAEIIERVGLGRKFYKNDDTGCYCTVGAIRESIKPGSATVLIDNPEAVQIEVKLATYLWEHNLVDHSKYTPNTDPTYYGDAHDIITHWSDSSTQEHVVETLRKVAEG